MRSQSFKIEKSKSWALVLGVDISVASMKYVLLRRGASGLKIEGFGKHLLGSDVEDAWEKLQSIISLLTKKGGTAAKSKIVVGIGDNKVILKKESLPNLQKKEMEQTLSFSLQQELSSVGDDGEPVFDYVSIGADPNQSGHTMYVCTAITEDSALQKIAPFISNEIIPDKISPTVTSIANLVHFLPKQSRKKTIGIVDIGHSRSVLVIVKNENTEFFREMMIGGHDLTKSIIGTIFHEGKAIQFGNDEAEEFKLRYGYPLGYSEGMVFHGAPLEEIATMVRPVVERLCGELQRSIEFYKDKSDDIVDEIFLIGGGASTKHLAAAISETISMPVEPLPFPDFIKFSGGQDNKRKFATKFLEQAPALALAMEKDNQTNLLPVQYKKELKKNARQGIFKLAAAVIVIMLALGWNQLDNVLKVKRAKLAKIEKQVSLTSSNIGFVYEALKTKESLINGKLNQVNLIGTQSNISIVILQVVSNILPDMFDLDEFQYNPSPETDLPQTPRLDEEGKPVKEPILVNLIGSARKPANDVEVYLARFIIDLEATGIFSEVKLENKIYETSEPRYKTDSNDLIVGKAKTTFNFKIVATLNEEVGQK